VLQPVEAQQPELRSHDSCCCQPRSCCFKSKTSNGMLCNENHDATTSIVGHVPCVEQALEEIRMLVQQRSESSQRSFGTALYRSESSQRSFGTALYRSESSQRFFGTALYRSLAKYCTSWDHQLWGDYPRSPCDLHALLPPNSDPTGSILSKASVCRHWRKNESGVQH
jgi:hypothetical protein